MLQTCYISKKHHKYFNFVNNTKSKIDLPQDMLPAKQKYVISSQTVL